MYISYMKDKTIPFTEVRQNLTTILDEVESSGKPVTIMRRGKPVAVIISHDTYEARFAKIKPPFRLAGSLQIAPGLDIDAALAKSKQERVRLRGKQRKDWKQEG